VDASGDCREVRRDKKDRTFQGWPPTTGSRETSKNGVAEPGGDPHTLPGTGLQEESAHVCSAKVPELFGPPRESMRNRVNGNMKRKKEDAKEKLKVDKGAKKNTKKKKVKCEDLDLRGRAKKCLLLRSM